MTFSCFVVQTTQTYSATSIDDLTAVTRRIHTLYPKAAIVGIGISLGGYATNTCIVLHTVDREIFVVKIFSSTTFSDEN